MEIDLLQMYFGEPTVINKHITLHQPKIRDIIRVGESAYFQTLYTLTAIPSDMKSQLWDMGICWEDIDDFTLFMMLAPTLDISYTSIFFGEIDFTKFQPGENLENHLPVLFQPIYSDEKNTDYIIIDQNIYQILMKLLRTMGGIVPKVERAGSQWVRNYLIEEQRKKIEENKDKPYSSTLLPLISSMLNSPEFKFSLNEIKEMPYYTFMDSVRRVQVIRNSTALLYGCYGGFIDTRKINKEDLDWMVDFTKEKQDKKSNGVMGL